MSATLSCLLHEFSLYLCCRCESSGSVKSFAQIGLQTLA